MTENTVPKKNIMKNSKTAKEDVLQPFSKDVLNQFLSENKIEDAKGYVKKYFFKILKPVCIFFYDVTEKSYYQLSHEDFSKGYITCTMIYRSIEGDKVKITKLSDWFKNVDTDDYLLSFDVNQPRRYTQGSLKYLNLFKGFKYAESKKTKITEDMKEKIKIIWDHIKIVICSNDTPVFNYLKKWICYFLTGRKMKTILYLKGTQGAGKSTLPTFLIDVIGRNNAYKTSSNSCLTNRFNAELGGIVLLVLEELRCSSTADWKAMNSNLNMIATEDIISLEEKGKTAINIKNNISTIILSNDSPIQMNKKDRRYLMTDVSNEKTGNVAYFNKLYTIMCDEHVQCAFFHECVEFAKSNEFNEQAELLNIETSAKTETIIKHLHPLYIYIKNEYVLKKNEFNVFLKDLTDLYNAQAKQILTGIDISRLLKEIGIEGKKSTGNRFRYRLTNDAILAIYKKNKWIHELDEFETDGVEEVKDGNIVLKDLTDVTKQKIIMESFHKLQLENEALKKEIEELKKIKKNVKEEIIKEEINDKKKPIQKKIFKTITTKTEDIEIPSKTKFYLDELTTFMNEL